MDPERRARLEEKRRELREETERERKRQALRGRTELLDTRGAGYEYVFDPEPQVVWVERHFPLTGGLFSPRIDWAKVPVHARGPEADADDAEVGAWLTRLATEKALAGSEVVMLVNGARAGLRLPFGAIATEPRIVSLSAEVWLACEAERWLLEFLPFGAGWCWGRAPV